MAAPPSPPPAPIVVEVKVTPNARHAALEPVADGPWRAHLKSPPIDGRANEELIALVARHFGRPKSAVQIRAGAGSRLKRLRID